MQYKKSFIPKNAVKSDNSYLNPKEVTEIILAKLHGNNFINQSIY
jgi:hypothetical protein